MSSLGIQEIKKFLPHSFPFLLVDRVLEIQSVGDLTKLAGDDKIGTRVRAQKNVSVNEPYFQGHFPNYPILPGVLIVEIMAQTASFALYPYVQADGAGASNKQSDKKLECILVGVDEARFRKPVVPGDVMEVEATLKRCRGKLWGFDCIARVNGQVVAEASILANFSL